MHPNPINFEPGQRFGRLVVIAKDLTPPTITGSRWVCRCDCGSIQTFMGSGLKRGETRSCGCLRRDDARARFTVHGRCYTTEFTIWMGMLDRCSRPNNTAYPNYGGRGITVCERWLSFENFYEDVGARPSQSYSLDRIDNDGPYSPENCRWATRAEQRRNSRNVCRIEYGGRTMILFDWAQELGFTYATLKHRIQRGWSVERAFTTPARSPKPR